jgi:CHAT domain-containing protein/tetratricopeptide (TPR) repeat protein
VRSLLALQVALLIVATGCSEKRDDNSSSKPAFAAADSLRIEGRSTLAGARYKVLRDSFEKQQDTASWWKAQLWLADALLKQGKRDSAEAAMVEATALAGRNADRIGWTRYEQSIFLDRIGKFDAAMIEARAAQRIGHAARDMPLEASSFSAMGRIHSLSGRYHEALASNQQAIALERSYGAEPRVIAKEMNELGIDYRHVGRLTDAVAIYDSALRIGRELGNPESIARVEFNLGTILQGTGDTEKALVLFSDALVRAKEINEVRGMAFIHGGLAELYTNAGAGKQARSHLDEALQINRKAKLTYGELQNLEALGRLDIVEGRLNEADPSLRSALAIADSAHYGKERSTTRAALARAAAAGKQPGAARRWADQAIVIADSLGDPESQLEARAARGIALESANDRSASSAYIDAIDLLESWRGRLALGDLRMGVAEPHTEIYEGAIRTLIGTGRSAAALEIAERARARLLLELMAEREMHDSGASPENKIRQLLRERFIARSDATGPAAAALDWEIDSLTTRLVAVQAAERAHDTQAGVRYPRPARMEEIRQGLLTPGNALLVFFWGERSVYGWWVSRNGISGARLGSADSLGASVDFLRERLAAADAGEDWRQSARRAYDKLISPLTPTSVGEVIVIPDGPLARLPLEAFIPSGDANPWGATTRFVYGPSASVLLALSHGSAAKSWPRGVLAVGNPKESGGSDPEGGSRGGTRLPGLPASAEEARQVGKLFGGDVLIGSNATIERWLALDPSRYRYLHFATHALVSDRHPQQTALVLADGSLGLDAIRRLRLSSELVTLSACETGLGQRVRGEGLIGLPHAFLASGAQAVVVSLWQVDDRTAAEYMADFYREIRNGHSPADAMLILRQSRLKGAAAHPSQWAPFILVSAPATSTPRNGLPSSAGRHP